MLKVTESMSQVIIVSNRLPISVKKDKGKLVFSSSIGGLATGLSSYVSNKKGNLWIGWPGIASDELTSIEKQEITDKLAKRGYVPVFLSKNLIDKFYNGYSNSVLWPVFHNLPFKYAASKEMDGWWAAYKTVNKRFSETVINYADQKSRIWVHDYQLMLMPEMLRQTVVKANIGFFLHIPFPEPRQYKRLDRGEALLKGVLGADLIGFHTTSYVANFSKSVDQLQIGIVNNDLITLGSRVVRAAEFPMGIDYAKFADANKLKNVKEIVQSYQNKYGKLKIIASVDRLDPSKGLMERLKAYQQFLRQYPNRRGKIVFVMVAAPSRTSIEAYKKLSKRLDKLSKDINQEFGTTKWQPLDYINIPLPFENVTALFQIADVAFIAPLRDGMNLAAKEFVASNRRKGVLILSETAGAAEELKDALIVNPKDPQTLVLALNKALGMRRTELKQRLRRMKRQLSHNTVQSWAKSFVDSLQQPLPGTPRITRGLNQRLIARLVNLYSTSNRRLLLLDYDGTLVPFTAEYAEANPSKALLSTIEELTKDKANEVVLISGRMANELEGWFGNLRINLVAEHGASIKYADQNRWKSYEKDSSIWKKQLTPILEKYVDLTPGAQLEVKPHSLVWHYRGASAYHAQKNLVAIKRVTKPKLNKLGLDILQGNKVIEIKDLKISKGAAASNWLVNEYNFILAIGDDVTDEDLFAVLPLGANSIKVGRGLTKAQFRTASYKDVNKLLKQMVAA
jgi:trehalose 6-phosphate synthase/phosphatase